MPIRIIFFNFKLISKYSLIGWKPPTPSNLPTSDTALRQVRDQLRIKHFEECEIVDFDCPIANLSDRLHMDVDIYSLNKLAKKIKDLLPNDGMVTKLLAALEAEMPEELCNTVDITEDLDRYELIPASVINATDYAHHVLFESGRYDIFVDDEISSFVDYEKYGNYKMIEDGVKQTAFGMIRRIDEPFQEQEQGFTQKMGGM